MSKIDNGYLSDRTYLTGTKPFRFNSNFIVPRGNFVASYIVINDRTDRK